MESFATTPGFCPVCGTILPELKLTGSVGCYNCKNNFEADGLDPKAYEIVINRMQVRINKIQPPAVDKKSLFGEMEVEYTIHFNSYDPEKKGTKIKQEKEEPDGPVVERRCPKCGYNKMSYATLQLRSADEGQTVFFTCLKCKFKESENS